VLALWLTRLGVGIRIIDKLAEAGTTSRALAVQARTLEFYRQLGIADLLVERGVKVAAINLWARGRRAARVRLATAGADISPFPFPLVFPQDAHERLLIEQLKGLGIEVERQVELVRLVEEPAGVRAFLRGPEGAEQEFEASYVAGCDGAHSAVRKSLGIGFPGGTYEGLFYVADVEAKGPATDSELHVDLDESDLLLAFPMKGQGRIRLVGSLRDTKGKDDGQLSFADVSSRAIQNLKFEIDKVNWFSTYRVHHRVADRFRQGRAFLLGDAAHVHSPAGGQGMNTGIGDAVNLSWKLAEVIRHASDQSLLDTYEKERIAFARRLVATTDRAFTLATARGGMAQFVRTRVIPLIAPLLFGLPGTPVFLFRTVSQISISYRDSPLSRGKAGKLAGGDRLPWVQISADEDNFSPLASLAWQVHVYGNAGTAMEDACIQCGIPLRTFAWSARALKAGLRRDALYLVRPDGYLALVDASGNADRLGEYLDARGLLRHGD
jgi:2-polyprenyl-6-methoxyphenol hydroxylase-like FAD-dependent oxidoreductase